MIRRFCSTSISIPTEAQLRDAIAPHFELLLLPELLESAYSLRHEIQGVPVYEHRAVLNDVNSALILTSEYLISKAAGEDYNLPGHPVFIVERFIRSAQEDLSAFGSLTPDQIGEAAASDFSLYDYVSQPLKRFNVQAVAAAVAVLRGDLVVNADGSLSLPS